MTGNIPSYPLESNKDVFLTNHLERTLQRSCMRQVCVSNFTYKKSAQPTFANQAVIHAHKHVKYKFNFDNEVTQALNNL